MQTYVLCFLKVSNMLISEIKVIFTAIPSDIDFLDLRNCW